MWIKGGDRREGTIAQHKLHVSDEGLLLLLDNEESFGFSLFIHERHTFPIHIQQLRYIVVLTSCVVLKGHGCQNLQCFTQHL